MCHKVPQTCEAFFQKCPKVTTSANDISGTKHAAEILKHTKCAACAVLLESAIKLDAGFKGRM